MVIKRGISVRAASMGNLQGHHTPSLLLGRSSHSSVCFQMFMALCLFTAGMDIYIGSHLSMTTPVSLPYILLQRNQMFSRCFTNLRHGPKTSPDNTLVSCMTIRGGNILAVILTISWLRLEFEGSTLFGTHLTSWGWLSA